LKGTYTLLLECQKPFRTRIGSLGHATIAKGYYVYTGSGQGKGSVSLEGRIGRHLRAAKKVKWHVDYLTAGSRCTVKAVVFLRSPRRLECATNKAVVMRLSAKPVLAHVGSSDCECEAHLSKVGASFRADGILASVLLVYRLLGKSVHCRQFVSSINRNSSALV
jgi:Uri superfamily endonuclease